MKVTAIIPAAGNGKRMKSNHAKPFIKIGRKEIICYTLRAMEQIPYVSETIVAVSQENISRVRRIIKREGVLKVRKIVEGGRYRSNSVFNALEAAEGEPGFILIHDCARPLIEKNIIERTIKAAFKYGCAIAAVRVKPTIKRGFERKLFIQDTLRRDCLWEAQTPQVFRADILKKAYMTAGRSISSFTDDAGVVEHAGYRVKIVESSYRNIKITTQEDLIIAEALLREE
jgi:2-C-methyl-D-erythritol 4-phosphate cytidylyltransferase